MFSGCVSAIIQLKFTCLLPLLLKLFYLAKLCMLLLALVASIADQPNPFDRGEGREH